MMGRNEQSDAARKGSPAPTPARGMQCTLPPAQGNWLPAYGGGMGMSAMQYDPDMGSAGDEVGNDYDAG